MRILMVVSDNTYPPDIRVEKEIKALMPDGHVIGVVRLRLGEEPLYEVINGTQVWRLKVPLRHVRLIGRALELTVFRHMLYRKIGAIARDFRPDVIHVHDLPLAMAAIKVATRVNARFVVDLHEHYIGLLEDRGLKGLLGWLMATILTKEERRVYPSADAIITVVEEHKHRIEQEFRVKDRVHAVSNTADIHALRRVKGHSKAKMRWDMCYVGAISPERGLDTFLDALSKVKQRIRVAIVGTGSGIDKLRAKAQNQRHDIMFTGHLPFSKAMECVASSPYGIIPYRRTRLTEHTVPHKLFQYMYLGAVPIVSDVPPLKRIVSTGRCGLVFRAGDADDLAHTIEKAMDIYRNHTDEWRDMAMHGTKAVEERYNWSADAEKLRIVYRNLEVDK